MGEGVWQALLCSLWRGGGGSGHGAQGKADSVISNTNLPFWNWEIHSGSGRCKGEGGEKEGGANGEEEA